MVLRCSHFLVIELRDAYLQIPTVEEFREPFTIATHKGYFRYKRIPFGINFAPSLFQHKYCQGCPLHVLTWMM